MKTVTDADLPQWLVDAVVGLVASAYSAGRAAQPVVVETIEAQPDVMDRLEAAAFLRCGRSKLDRMVRAGTVKSLMIGGRRMFRRSDLEAWVEEQSASAAA
jgi:excisionase family DNA binding protein